MCIKFNELPRAGGVLDQDCVEIRQLNIVADAIQEKEDKEKKERERKEKRGSNK